MIRDNLSPAGIFPNFGCCMKIITVRMNTIIGARKAAISIFLFIVTVNSSARVAFKTPPANLFFQYRMQNFFKQESYLSAMDTTTLPGEYYLKGMREMASGFLLKPDSSFQFFFSYGALDRQGSGKWAVKNNQLILNSAAKPLYDFALTESKKVPGDFITVRIKDNNTNLLRYMHCSLQNGIEGSWLPANNDGEVRIPKQDIATISLIFEFCTERFSTFSTIDKTHNDFTFRFEPWLMEVFLKDFPLQIDKDGLFGKHPLMGGEEYRYGKE